MLKYLFTNLEKVIYPSIRNHTPGLLILCCVSVLTLMSCGSNTAKESEGFRKWEEKDWGIYSNPYRVVEAVKNRDISEFASLCRYPIIREYPLKDIRDSVEMMRKFQVIFDDSLINKISQTTPDDWEEYGWRGLTFGRGEFLWLDENVYAITYQSAKEKTELEKLTDRDLKSLPSDLSKGWKPEFCFLDTVSSKVYRIDIKENQDSEEEEKIRVIIADLQNINDFTSWEIIDGIKKIEGTMGVRSYYFPMKDGEEYSLSYIWQEDSAFLSDSTADDYHDLQKTYWIDLINP